MVISNAIFKGGRIEYLQNFLQETKENIKTLKFEQTKFYFDSSESLKNFFRALEYSHLTFLNCYFEYDGSEYLTSEEVNDQTTWNCENVLVDSCSFIKEEGTK
jgi:hypothetical protein